MNIFKSFLLRRELKKRIIKEYHIKSGGCLFCDIEGKYAQCLMERPSLYFAIVGCSWSAPQCPLEKSRNAQEILDGIKIK